MKLLSNIKHNLTKVFILHSPKRLINKSASRLLAQAKFLRIVASVINLNFIYLDGGFNICVVCNITLQLFGVWAKSRHKIL